LFVMARFWSCRSRESTLHTDSVDKRAFECLRVALSKLTQIKPDMTRHGVRAYARPRGFGAPVNIGNPPPFEPPCMAPSVGAAVYMPGLMAKALPLLRSPARHDLAELRFGWVGAQDLAGRRTTGPERAAQVERQYRDLAEPSRAWPRLENTLRQPGAVLVLGGAAAMAMGECGASGGGGGGGGHSLPLAQSPTRPKPQPKPQPKPDHNFTPHLVIRRPGHEERPRRLAYSEDVGRGHIAPWGLFAFGFGWSTKMGGDGDRDRGVGSGAW
jgi:hypothetical protein